MRAAQFRSMLWDLVIFLGLLGLVPAIVWLSLCVFSSPNDARLRVALEDFVKTNRELRATSAQLRLTCEPWPKVRPATQAGA